MKQWSGSKKEHKLSSSTFCDRRSAWSYSYDLTLQKVSEEASRKKSYCSGTEDEDTSSSSYNIVDLDDDFIFKGNCQAQELDVNDCLRGSVTKDVNYSSLEDKSLRFSDFEEVQSSLAILILPSPKVMGNSDKIKYRKQEKICSQIRVSSVNNTEHLIEKTTPPPFQKPEQLQLDFHREKIKWKKQVDFLKQQNSLLKSELQDWKKAYQKISKQLTFLKNFDSKNQSVVKRNFDIDRDSQMVSVVSEKLILSQQKYEVAKEHMDVKSACCKTNHPEMERSIIVNENKINEKNFLKFKKTLSNSESLSLNPLRQTFIHKPVCGKKIWQDNKNKHVPNDSKKLKLGNTEVQKKLDMETRSHNNPVSFGEELKTMNPLLIKSPEKEHPLLKTTKCIGNDKSCREAFDKFLMGCKSDWTRTTLGDDKKCISCVDNSSGVSLKVSRYEQSSQQLKEKLLPKTDSPKSNALIYIGYSLKHRNHEKLKNAQNERVSKVDKKEIFLDLQKSSQESNIWYI